MTAAPAVSSLADLVRFLIARVDDEEDELKRVRRHQSRGTSRPDPVDTMRTTERLMAECAVKRSMIAAAQHLLVLRDQPAEKAVREVAAQMLHALLLPYRGHVSYRHEWDGAIRL